MGLNHKTLVNVMDVAGYYILPDYPFEDSLNEIEYDKYDEVEVEHYCYNVLTNLQALIDANTEFQLTKEWMIEQGLADEVFLFESTDKHAIVLYKFNGLYITLQTDDITNDTHGCSASFDNYRDASADYHSLLEDWYGGVM